MKIKTRVTVVMDGDETVMAQNIMRKAMERVSLTEAEQRFVAEHGDVTAVATDIATYANQTSK